MLNHNHSRWITRCIVLLAMAGLALVFAPSQAAAVPPGHQCEPGSYYCYFPTGDVTDGRMVSQAGTQLSTLVGVGTEFDILVEHTGDWELGIFDGDTGKDATGLVTNDVTKGYWDHAAPAVNTQLFYRLYADPQGTLTFDDIAGPDGQPGTGDEFVQPLYVWPGNAVFGIGQQYPGVSYFADPAGFPTGGVQMVDNAWFGISLPASVAAETSRLGTYRYRLRADLEVPETFVESSFKLRSTGTISPRANRPFQVIGALRRSGDFATMYPQYPDLTVTPYDGMWSLFMYVPVPQERLDIWDGDFDFGPEIGVPPLPRDTDDLDSPAVPFFVGETGGQFVAEGAQDFGVPPEDNHEPIYRREATAPGLGQVRYDVNYRGPGSTSGPVLWSVANNNPSGDKEWEKFTLSTVVGCEVAAGIGERCDHEVAELPAGYYEIALDGLDMANIVALRLPFDMLGTARLGDYVWFDSGPAQNHLQDGWESGIAGVTLELWADDGDGIFNPALDTQTGLTQTTDGAGYYLFEGLLPGDYFVVIPPSETDVGGTLFGLNPSTPDVGGAIQDVIDSDGQIVTAGGFRVVSHMVSLAAGGEDLTIDFGFNDSGGASGGYLGNQVWVDANQNGIYEPGQGEQGINGVVINVYWDQNADGVGDILVRRLVTGDGFGPGEYYAPELFDAQYVVEVDASNFDAGGALEGYIQTTTYTRAEAAADDHNRDSGYTVVINTSTGPSVDLTADFGYIAPGRIGNQLWCETDADGIFQAGAADNPPLAGVLVKLLDGLRNEVASQTTGADGTYLFQNLTDDDYQVVVDESSSILSGLFPTVLNPSATLSGDDFNRPLPYGVTLAGGVGAGGQNQYGADFGYRPELCFQDPTDPDNGATIAYWIDDVGAGNGTVTVRVKLARTFADTAYGPNSTATGWPGKKGRKFGQIVGSDNLELTLTNGDGAVAMRFAMDLLAKDESPEPPTYRTGGIKQGPDAGLRQNDGSISVGSAAHVLGVRTSISENLNNTTWTDLTNSPLVDANYEGTETPDGWDWDTWYEVTVDLAAFGTSGFGTPSITDLHSSPSKTGEDKPDVEPCPSVCPGDIPPPPDEECEECAGKVTQLTLQYNGAVEDAHIEVYQKKGEDWVFDSDDTPLVDGQFTFTGTDNGTLGTEISIYVDGVLNTKIHTSCSQPIGPGLISGDFEVIEGYSKDGGLMCPIPEPGQQPFECDKPINELTMIWNGTQTVNVEAWKGTVGSTSLGTVTGVAPGDEVVFTGFAGSPNDVYWEIFDASTNNTLGKSVFHVSCSDPDMNGIEDCGKAEGDGKGKSGVLNDWLLEGMVGSKGALSCSP